MFQEIFQSDQKLSSIIIDCEYQYYVRAYFYFDYGYLKNDTSNCKSVIKSIMKHKNAKSVTITKIPRGLGIIRNKSITVHSSIERFSIFHP